MPIGAKRTGERAIRDQSPPPRVFRAPSGRPVWQSPLRQSYPPAKFVGEVKFLPPYVRPKEPRPPTPMPPNLPFSPIARPGVIPGVIHELPEEGSSEGYPLSIGVRKWLNTPAGDQRTVLKRRNLFTDENRFRSQQAMSTPIPNQDNFGKRPRILAEIDMENAEFVAGLRAGLRDGLGITTAPEPETEPTNVQEVPKKISSSENSKEDTGYSTAGKTSPPASNSSAGRTPYPASNSSAGRTPYPVSRPSAPPESFNTSQGSSTLEIEKSKFTESGSTEPSQTLSGDQSSQLLSPSMIPSTPDMSATLTSDPSLYETAASMASGTSTPRRSTRSERSTSDTIDDFFAWVDARKGRGRTVTFQTPQRSIRLSPDQSSNLDLEASGLDASSTEAAANAAREAQRVVEEARQSTIKARKRKEEAEKAILEAQRAKDEAEKALSEAAEASKKAKKAVKVAETEQAAADESGTYV